MSYTVLQCPVLTAKERPHPPLFAADESAFRAVRRFDARRIFDSIRRLGGMSRPKVKCYDLRSTRALRVEGDIDDNPTLDAAFVISIHALRVEGDTEHFNIAIFVAVQFLSTPSGWRATSPNPVSSLTVPISIHALRVEGDSCGSIVSIPPPKYFYPRPPGGGRLLNL